jgi:hypothetical protein
MALAALVLLVSKHLNVPVSTERTPTSFLLTYVPPSLSFFSMTNDEFIMTIPTVLQLRRRLRLPSWRSTQRCSIRRIQDDCTPYHRQPRKLQFRKRKRHINQECCSRVGQRTGKLGYGPFGHRYWNACACIKTGCEGVNHGQSNLTLLFTSPTRIVIVCHCFFTWSNRIRVEPLNFV